MHLEEAKILKSLSKKCLVHNLLNLALGHPINADGREHLLEIFVRFVLSSDDEHDVLAGWGGLLGGVAEIDHGASVELGGLEVVKEDEELGLVL